jgi:Fe-S oxidoreductase
MRNEATDKQELLATTISHDEIMACRTCRACMEHCPVSIEHVDSIVDLRRHLVDTGRISEPAQKTLRNIASEYNPWGLPYSERAAWMKQIPRAIADKMVPPGEAEVLYWVGCAASYDERASKVAIAFLSLLVKGEVKCSVLGAEEKCNGELARRIGEEGLFQTLVQQNIETLNRHKVKKVVTTCPHCFNTLKNEYPKFGADILVQDHSSVLDEYLRQKKLTTFKVEGKEKTSKITYHDPCYLGRYNDVYDSPRSVLKQIENIEVSEMKRHRDKSFCCGAGGANYWYEVSHKAKCENIRLNEARATNADMLAVACPFCLAMFTEAARRENVLDEFAIQDVAEILANRLDE